MKKGTIILMLFAFIAGNTLLKAQQPAVIMSDKTGWHKIADSKVDFHKEAGEIVLIGANRFAQLKFKVLDAPINIESIEVVYEKGEPQKIMIRNVIEQNGESRAVDLNGGERDIKRINFVYKTLPNRKDEKAVLEVWGYKSNMGKK